MKLKNMTKSFILTVILATATEWENETGQVSHPTINKCRIQQDAFQVSLH